MTLTKKELEDIVLRTVDIPEDHKVSISWNTDGSLTIVDLCQQHGKDVGCFLSCPKIAGCS